MRCRPKRACQQQQQQTEVKKRRVVVNNDVLHDIFACVKQSHSPVVSFDEKNSILLMHAKIRHDYAVRKRKNPKTPKIDIDKTVAECVQRSRRVVTAVWNDYIHLGGLSASGRRGNNLRKKTRIPRTYTKKVMETIITFIRRQRSQGRRVVARHIMDLLEQQDILDVDRHVSQSVQTAERTRVLIKKTLKTTMACSTMSTLSNG